MFADARAPSCHVTFAARDVVRGEEESKMVLIERRREYDTRSMRMNRATDIDMFARVARGCERAQNADQMKERKSGYIVERSGVRKRQRRMKRRGASPRSTGERLCRVTLVAFTSFNAHPLRPSPAPNIEPVS